MSKKHTPSCIAAVLKISPEDISGEQFYISDTQRGL